MASIVPGITIRTRLFGTRNGRPDLPTARLISTPVALTAGRCTPAGGFRFGSRTSRLPLDAEDTDDGVGVWAEVNESDESEVAQPGRKRINEKGKMCSDRLSLAK